MPAESDYTDAHGLRDSTDLTVNDDEFNTKEYALERIVGHTQRNSKTTYFIRWYEYVCKEDTVDLPELLPDHLITRFWCRIGKRTTVANAHRSE